MRRVLYERKENKKNVKLAFEADNIVVFVGASKQESFPESGRYIDVGTVA